MATTQYIGARYVPLFADPAEWDSTKQYEPLTIVLHEGNSYTSKQYVPAGIEITNEKFWALTGNYNAQVEAYRQEVRAILPLDKTPTDGSTKGVTSDGIKKAISDETTRAKTAEQTNSTAISDETTRAKTAEQANSTAISNEITRATDAENTLSSKIDAAINTSEKNAMLLNSKNAVVFGDSTAANNPSYFTMLSEKTGMNITNRAIPGTTLTPQGVSAWSQVKESGTDGYSLIKRQTDLADFDIVFLAYSTNDWQTSQRVRNAGMNDNNYISYSAALQKVINYIQSINKNAFIVFVAPAYGYRKWNGIQVNCNSKGFMLRDYAIMAEKIMYENQMGFIDLGNIGVNYNNYTNWLLNDSGGIFVHYNENLKSRIVDYIIGSYPWKPRYIETPEARNISTYRSTYIDSLKICDPLNATDSSDSRKTICYGNYKSGDNGLIGNCNAALTGNLNQIALSENIDFTDGFDGLVYIVSMKGDPVVITAENTDYQLKTQAKELDIAWLAIHVPPTNAAGRLIMTRADTSNSNPIVAICVCEADNVCCSPKQIRHYNLSGLAIADNLAVNYNVFGITDTVHINGTVKNTGVGFKISNACAALANTYDFNNPHNFANNIYANGCKSLLIQLDSAGGLTLFISSAVSTDAGYQWNISI